MTKLRLVLATAVALTLLALAPAPLAASAASEPSCEEEGETRATMTPLAEGYYLASPVHEEGSVYVVTPSWAAVWHEENGIPGIQANPTRCYQVVEGRVTSWTVPPDRKVAGGPDLPGLPWGCTIQPFRCSIPL